VSRLGATEGGVVGEAGAVAYRALSRGVTKQWMNACGVKTVEIFTEIAQLMQDASEVVAIIFAAWFFIRLKVSVDIYSHKNSILFFRTNAIIWFRVK